MSIYKTRNIDTGTNTLLGCWLIYWIFALSVGGYSFHYCLGTIFGKNVNWFVDFIAGIFVAAATIPLMIICWIATLCGVHVPFVH